jgi:nucleotide-binding universal stress UspA family protein
MKTMTLEKPAVPPAASRRPRAKVANKSVRVRRILIPVDFSKPSLDSIDYASRLATRLGAELNLVHVFEQYVFGGLAEIPTSVPDEEIAIRARTQLETIAKRHGIPLRAEHIHVTEGRPVEEICRLASKLQIDLIVIPTHGNTGLKRLTLGSTAERVVRYSPCPVLVLRSVPPARRRGVLPAASVRFSKILVPTDFSKGAMKALTFAKSLAQEFNAKLILLNSVALQYYLSSDEYARYDLPLLMQQAEKASREQMRDVIRTTDWGGIKVEGSLQIGHAGDKICSRAKDFGADLIVTATHGRTGLKHVLIGSTAEYVVRHAHCPVLVVPTRPTSSSLK